MRRASKITLGLLCGVLANDTAFYSRVIVSNLGELVGALGFPVLSP